MPPKKGKKAAPAAPVRRSARIRSQSQSREPSMEMETEAPVLPVPAVVDVITSPPKRSPSPPLTEVVKKTPSKKYTPIRREFTLAKLRQEAAERARKEEEEAAKARELATPVKQLPSPPTPEQAAPPATAPQPHAAPEQQPGWRKIISSLSGYLASPFVRKRSIEEDETPIPTNKRTRMQEPSEVSDEEAVFASGAPQSTNKRRRSEEPSEDREEVPKFSKVLTAKDTPKLAKRKRVQEAEDYIPRTRTKFTPVASNVTSTPKDNFTTASDVNITSTPVASNIIATPKAENITAPKANITTTPKRNVTSTPKITPTAGEIAFSPESEIKAAPDTVATSHITATPDIAARAQETPFAQGASLEEEGEADQTPIARSQPVKTPYSDKHRKSPSPRAGPSTKRPNEPTSLSTITEYNEPSFFSQLSEIEEASPTPSKPSRVPRASSLLDMPQSTPKQPLQTRQGTPRRTPMGTPLMRRAAQLRAAREAEQTGFASPKPITYPFMSAAYKPAPPKPKETNADARRAKLERMRELQRELEELQKDEDVQEMQSHRRKRVKIDRLVTIPHNLPGDSSGTFRVPEIDSDDEMEVYDDVEERSNVFEDSERMVQDIPSLPRPQPVQTPKETYQAPPAAAIETPAAVSVQQPIIEFNFPEIGPIPEGYHVTDEYREEACRIFEQGLAEFLAT